MLSSSTCLSYHGGHKSDATYVVIVIFIAIFIVIFVDVVLVIFIAIFILLRINNFDLPPGVHKSDRHFHGGEEDHPDSNHCG